MSCEEHNDDCCCPDSDCATPSPNSVEDELDYYKTESHQLFCFARDCYIKVFGVLPPNEVLRNIDDRTKFFIEKITEEACKRNA